jgi:CRP-like cAMP-binding protein
MSEVVHPLGHYVECPAPLLEASLAAQREMAKAGTRKRIGEVMLEAGYLSQEQLTEGLIRQRIDRLAVCPMFPEFTRAELDRLAQVAKEVTAEPGEVFIQRDSMGDCLFVIAAGKVQVFAHYEGAEESTLAILGAGESIGEMGYFTGGRRTASARAIERTHLLCVSYRDLEDCFKMVPNLAGGFLRIITNRLRELNQQYSASTHRARLSEESLKQMSE